jgi:hypothetical protein
LVEASASNVNKYLLMSPSIVVGQVPIQFTKESYKKKSVPPTSFSFKKPV